MENLIPIAGAAAGAGVSVSGLFVWIIKRWVKRIDTRLDDINNVLLEIRLNMAERKGKADLVWKEINTDKHKITLIETKLERACEILSKLVSPRITELLDKETKT